MPLQAAIFLDRDGTMIEDVGYLHRPEQVMLLPSAAEGIVMMRQLGYRIVIVTNQSGIARGYFTEKDYHLAHERLLQLLEEKHARVDAAYFCPHHPEGAVPSYRIECECRKPKPGMLRRAAKELGLDLKRSVMMGNSEVDIRAGQAAGCRTILIGAVGTEQSSKPDYVARNLLTAASWLKGLP